MNKQLPILMISGKMILLESMAEVLNPWLENLQKLVLNILRYNFMQIEDMKYYLKLITNDMESYV